MHRNPLNGFAYTLFRPVGPDRWIVADSRSRGRLLPSREAGLALRRRAMWGWSLTCAVALGVALWDVPLLEPPVVLAAGLGAIWGSSQHRIKALPLSGDLFTGRERLYQFRGLLALVAAATCGLSLFALWVGLACGAPIGTVVGALLLAFGALLVAVVIHASRADGAPQADRPPAPEPAPRSR